MADADVQKRLKALNKKLGQIAKLREKDTLTEEEHEKVASEPNIKKEIQALERGEPVQPQAPASSPAESAKPPAAAQELARPASSASQAPSPAAAVEPTSPEAAAAAPEQPASAAPAECVQLEPAEAEKRIKNLRKKLGQIEKLKEKAKADLSAEEKEKLSRKSEIEKEVRDLEINLLEPEAKKSAINIQRKIEQIKMLKARGDGGQLNSSEREKISKEQALQKELEDLLSRRAASNGKA